MHSAGSVPARRQHIPGAHVGTAVQRIRPARPPRRPHPAPGRRGGGLLRRGPLRTAPGSGARTGHAPVAADRDRRLPDAEREPSFLRRKPLHDGAGARSVDARSGGSREEDQHEEEPKIAREARGGGEEATSAESAGEDHPLAEPIGQRDEIVCRPRGSRLRERLREGLRQVRAAAGIDAVCTVVEVAPWSRIPEARALFVPRDD